MRGLCLSLPLTARVCRCGRLLDVIGHHRSACAVSGVLGVQGSSAGVRSRQGVPEAGARVSTNVFVRADGLPLFGGAQLAVDTTLVSVLRSDGSATRQAARRDGVALVEARRRKERTYPEFAGDEGRVRLVVLTAEVGGRWSADTLQFLKQQANAKSRSSSKLSRASSSSVPCGFLLAEYSIVCCSSLEAFCRV